MAADRRAGTSHHRGRADGAGGLRPPQGWSRADRTGPGARARRRVPPAAPGSAAGRCVGPGARRVLRGRRRARLQRLDLHGPRDRQHPFGHRVGGRGCDRRAQGTVARRGAIGGRRPAPRDGIRRPGRGVDPSDAGTRRAADGLRPSRLPRLRSSRRGAASRRRGDDRRRGLARQGGGGRGDRPSRARRAQAGLPDQDERRVLRGRRAAGCRAPAEPLPGDVRAGAPRRVDGALPRAGRGQRADPTGCPVRGSRRAAPPA